MHSHFTPARSRREFLERSGLGFGALAASWMLQRDAAAAPAIQTNPFAPKPQHFKAKG